MHYHLLSVISFLCLLHTGLSNEECIQTVLAERETKHVPAGGSQSLSCVVRHCGGHWDGTWIQSNSTGEKLNVNHLVTKVVLSVNETELILNLWSVSKLDEGSYGCRVTWADDVIERGHLTYVNVTAAVTFQRSVLHRILVCASASLCLPIILGLAYCLSSKVKPQTLPRTLYAPPAVDTEQPHPAPQPPPRCPVPQKRSKVPHKAAPKSQQKTEVVYAAISQDALRQQGATRAPDQSTVYSSLRFT